MTVQVDPTPNPTVIRAAGGLLWRRNGPTTLLAIIHRPRYGDWSLPKGKLQEGESWEQAALREVKEETGCVAEVTEFASTVSYLVRAHPKVVVFYHMRILGECSFQPSEEVDQIRWVTFRHAVRELNHPVERQLLKGLSGPRRT